MTSHDVDEFGGLLRSVAQVHGKKVESFATAYFDALKDIPIATLRLAKDHLVTTARFWPKPVDWRAAAQKVETRHAMPMPVESVTNADGTTTRVYVCLRCEDTGWAPECGCDAGTQDGRGHCPTHGGLEKHGIVYRQPVKPCVCRATNVVWQFHHQARRVEPERVRTDG